jgi:hypothetical protein
LHRPLPSPAYLGHRPKSSFQSTRYRTRVAAPCPLLLESAISASASCQCRSSMLASYSFSVASGADQEASDPTLRFCYGDRSRQPRLPCSADPAPPIASASIFFQHTRTTPRSAKRFLPRAQTSRRFLPSKFPLILSCSRNAAWAGTYRFPQRVTPAKTSAPPRHASSLPGRGLPGGVLVRHARRAGAVADRNGRLLVGEEDAAHHTVTFRDPTQGAGAVQPTRRSWRPGGRRGRPASGCRSACRRA